MGFENFTIQTWWILASTNWISAMNDGLGRVRRWSIPQNINFDGTYDDQSWDLGLTYIKPSWKCWLSLVTVGGRKKNKTWHVSEVFPSQFLDVPLHLRYPCHGSSWQHHLAPLTGAKSFIYIYVFFILFFLIVYVYIYIYVYACVGRTWARPQAIKNMSRSILETLEINKIIEGSLEVKLPTIWTVEKQRWEESEETRSEERRGRCAKR